MSTGGATLNGTAINNNDTTTRAWFQYGPTTSYGSVSSKKSFNQSTGTTPVSYSNTVSGLTVGTLYHFSSVATNATGTSYGADFTFTTLPATTPTITTNFATSLGVTNATLNGKLNANGLTTGAWFEWGLSTNYGNVTTTTNLTGGTTNQNFSMTIVSLGVGVNYYFRAVATNSLGSTYGEGQSFITAIVAEVTATVAPGLQGVYSASVAWGDYDNDGRLDFLLTGLLGDNVTSISQIWRNTGNGFTNVTANVAPGLPGISSSSVAWGDYDNDGRLDFLFTGSGVSQIWHNTGSNFENVSVTIAPGLPGVQGSSVAWGDYNNDGHLDFIISGMSNTPPYTGISQIWRNTESNFMNVTASIAPGLPGVAGSVAWGDYDKDGRLDFLIIGSGFAQIWHNTGSNFVNVTASVAPGLPGVRGYAAWGDYDNDGRLDFIITGQLANNTYISKIWHNTGSNFVDITVSAAPDLFGVYGSVAWGDYDNDGRLDFLLTGYTNNSSIGISQIWRNTGSNFVNVTPIVAPSLPGVTRSFVTWGDYDNDGRLDLLLTGTGFSANLSQIWRNFTLQTNTAPAAPSGLAMTSSANGALLSWNAATDAQTPSAGLTYNVRAGTTPGGTNLIAFHSDASGFRRVPAMGNAQKPQFLPLAGVTNGQTIYWSVQAVDSAFAGGPFATQCSAISTPQLKLAANFASNSVISWSPPTWGWRLQESPNLTTGMWSDSLFGEMNPVTLPSTNTAKFFRLFNP